MFKTFFNTLKDGARICQKDLLDFSRDRARLISFTIMPIFMMIMTGFIFPSQNSLKNIPLGMVDESKTEVSQKIIQVFSTLKLGNSQEVFELKYFQTADEAKEKIKSQEINGAVIIPADFTANLTHGEKAQTLIIPDQSNPQIAMMLTQIIEKITASTSSRFAQSKVDEIIKIAGTVSPQLAKLNPAVIIEPIQIQTEDLVPGNPNYFQFVAPGIMALVVMMAVMTGLAGSVSRERETGTLDGLLIAPISRLSIILGKALAQTVRGLFQGLVILLLAILIFKVHIFGSWLMLILLLILGVFAFMGIGILISALSSEQETAMTIMMTIQFPMMFLSGAFFPILQMPKIMQYISKAIPLTYEIEALRKVIVLGAGPTAVWREVLILFVFGVLTLAIAVPTFKRVITK